MVALDLADRRQVRRAALERLFGPLPPPSSMARAILGRSLADPATGQRRVSARAYPASFAALLDARRRLAASRVVRAS